jgi:hypothetical protein
MKSIPTIAMLLALSGLTLSGCSKGDDIPDSQVPNGRSGTPTAAFDSALNHFWFDYNHEPDPGRRVWMRTGDDIWAELYPNGTISRYKRSGRGRLNGEDGTVVRKFEGDITQTLVPNDGSFEAFFPDRTATNRVLFYRHLRGSKWGAWRALAPLNPIE